MSAVLHTGDCLEVLKTLPDSSVDAVVTDAPYGLAFMGKRWDYDVPGVEVWAECLRVLKPGGHLLAFAGTRTQHRMCCRIEDAGFEIRDMLAWVYGSGFPKSLNIGKSPLFCQCSSNNVPPSCNADHKDCEQQASRRTNTGLDSTSEACPCGRAGCVQNDSHRSLDSQSDCPNHHCSCDEQPPREEAALRGAAPSQDDALKHTHSVEPLTRTPADNADTHSRPLCSVHPSTQDCSPPSVSPLLSPCDPQSRSHQKDLLPNEKVGRNGENKTCNGQTSLGSFGNVRTSSSRTSIGFDNRIVCPGCGKVKSDGQGTALKPALEPITLARKPLTGTVAANVLEHGTGALNVDGCRVGTESTQRTRTSDDFGIINDDGWKPTPGVNGSSSGRFPANFIHDGSDEVTDLLGNAARFFYCAKASRSERDAGLTVEPRAGIRSNAERSSEAEKTKARINNHPTVKPVALMRYLVRLVTPPGCVVLDPYMGSGTTGVACRLEGMQFIGIEQDPAYVEIARQRIEAAGRMEPEQADLFREDGE